MTPNKFMAWLSLYLVPRILIVAAVVVLLGLAALGLAGLI